MRSQCAINQTSRSRNKNEDTGRVEDKIKTEYDRVSEKNKQNKEIIRIRAEKGHRGVKVEVNARFLTKALTSFHQYLR